MTEGPVLRRPVHPAVHQAVGTVEAEEAQATPQVLPRAAEDTPDPAAVPATRLPGGRREDHILPAVDPRIRAVFPRLMEVLAAIPILAVEMVQLTPT